MKKDQKRKVLTIFLITLGCLSCSSSVQAGKKEDPLKIEKDKKKMGIDVLFHIEAGRLFIGLLNTSNDLKLVSRKFVYGGFGGVENTIQMKFIDQSGQELPFRSRIKAPCPEKVEEILLNPGEYVGRSWPISEIMGDYGLESGKKYKVELQYQIPEICQKARTRLSFSVGKMERREVNIP